jgi:MYXO-CTERM domain-containing protein
MSLLGRFALLTLILCYFLGISNAHELWHTTVPHTAGPIALMVLVALALHRRRIGAGG